MLSDLRLPKGDGMGVLRAVKEVDGELPVIVMTAHGSIQDAVEAMKHGALDFLAKPVDPDHLLLLVSRALEQRRLLSEYRLLKEEAAARRGGPNIIGDSPALRQVMAAIERAAGTDTTVLLEGESGTGKELCARALHNASPRANGPFVAINCAAIPENLLEAELFGYERGAFTGADAAQDRQVRDGAARHHLPRRDRRDAARRCRPRCCARSRPSASSGSAATPRFTSTSASSPRPTGCCGRRWRRASSARICISGCRCSR